MRRPVPNDKFKKNRRFTIVFSFRWTGKIRYERGKHSRVFIFLFVLIWKLDDAFLEYMTRVAKKPRITGGKEQLN